MPAVEASSVSKSFGQQQIIAPLDLTIRKGEFVSLIGSSGCGKSTLLHLCAGLQEPTSGSIKIFGRTPAAACAAHEIGLACQRPALVPSRTALQNVQLTLTIAKPKQALQPAELLRHFRSGYSVGSDYRVVPATRYHRRYRSSQFAESARLRCPAIR